MDLADLAKASTRELRRLHAAGAEPKLDDLAGWEWRGFNPPAFAKALGIQKFVKGFFRGPDGAEGYNVWASQRDWRRWQWRGRPARHGWYTVAPGVGRFVGTVLLDYGASRRNRKPNPERLLRDTLVHPDPEDRDLLLGLAYVKAGGLVPVSFFVLERDREVDTPC